MATNINYKTVPPNLSVRGHEGVYILAPNNPEFSDFSKFHSFHDEFKNCRANAFDPNGRYFAYCNNSHVKVIDLENECKLIFQIEKPRTSYLRFSPSGSYLTLWETFHVASKEDPKEICNLNIYELKTGSIFKSMCQKKQSENFIDWSHDETVFAYMVSNEIFFFEKTNPETPRARLKIDNLQSFSMNPFSKCVAAHASGKKNEPSFIRLIQYPNLESPLANKSFFNADRVEFKWNKSGNNLLLLCSTETSQNSYYGDSTLHQIRLNGESQLIQLSKKGPIYDLAWNLARDEFIVVYGTMPAKATLFNNKGEPIYDFGTGSRNEIFFSPHGNIVALAGFGNLRGVVEIWNLSTSNKVPQKIVDFLADDTTYFEWCPDGEHILTATTAPRLRVSNGFKIWNYNGEKKFTYQMPTNHELWRIEWQPGCYAQKPVIKKVVQQAKEETKAYVPPHLRNASGANKQSTFKSKLHEDDEKPDKALKIKVNQPSGAEDIEKKIKNLKKKLSQIEDLKKRQKSGENLEKNQLEKLSHEKEILEELKKLNIN